MRLACTRARLISDKLILKDFLAPYKRINYPYKMQAKMLLERTACPESVLKDWVKNKVILPARSGRGAGIHAVYDEPNAVALLVGLEMKQATITVVRYARAFAQLHDWLRTHSSLTWAQHVAVMSPGTVVLHRAQKLISTDHLSIVIPLAPICSVLSLTSGETQQAQRSLLALQAIRRA